MNSILRATAMPNTGPHKEHAKNGRPELPQGPIASFRSLIEREARDVDVVHKSNSLNADPKPNMNPREGELQSEDERTYQFLELGMFGRHEKLPDAPAGSGSQQECTVAGATPSVTQSSSLVIGQTMEPGIGANPIDYASAQTVASSADAKPALSSAVDALTDVLKPSSIVQLVPSEGGVSFAFGQCDVESAERSASPLPRQTNPTTAPVNLVVTGTADQIVVAARSQSATQDDGTKLRKLFDDVAREFGVEVLEIHLNGAFAERVIEGGGAHGGRVR